MGLLNQIDDWPPTKSAAAWLTSAGVQETHGPISQTFQLASITKALFAYAALVAVEEGTLDLNQPAGPEGSTVRHLLAHASGLGFAAEDSVIAVGQRRVYSNVGFDQLAKVLSTQSGMSATQYFQEAVADQLGLSQTSIPGSVAHSGVSSVSDLALFAAELLCPTLISSRTLAHARSPQFGQLHGIVPGFGRFTPNPWGLGFEIRGAKTPHWTGATNSEQTFGHFGARGTMLWVDPVAERALVFLGDLDFGPWAKPLWPVLSDAVLAASV